MTWPIPGIQPNQPPPNTPTITRMDRGPGLALAIRGDAPFSLTPVEKELKATPGGKLEVTLKITRDAKFKDEIQVFSAVPELRPAAARQPAAATGRDAHERQAGSEDLRSTCRQTRRRERTRSCCAANRRPRRRKARCSAPCRPTRPCPSRLWWESGKATNHRDTETQRRPKSLSMKSISVFCLLRVSVPLWLVFLL